MFGTAPKIGFTSTPLHPLVFNNITTEEQLYDDLKAKNSNLHLTDQDECESEVEQECLTDFGKQNDNKQNDDEQYNEQNDDEQYNEQNDDEQYNEQNDDEQHNDERSGERLNIITNKVPNPLNNRITITDAIRRKARED